MNPSSVELTSSRWAPKLGVRSCENVRSEIANVDASEVALGIWLGSNSVKQAYAGVSVDLQPLI